MPPKKSKITDEQREQWKLGCRAFFPVWFQSGAKIQPKDPTKLVTPLMNSMQGRIDEAIEWCAEKKLPCRVVNLKPRQGGSSSYFVGRAYHKARTEVCNVAILGDDGNTTEKLMKMWKRYGENDAMQPHWGNREKTVSWLEFSHGSSLTLETANDPRAGQGGTFQVLIASEVASYRSSGHSTGEDVFSSIAGCVPRLAGTLIVLESTAQGQTGIFYTTYQGAVTFEEFKAGKRGNGYIKFFTPWFDFEDYQFDGQNGRKSISEAESTAILHSLDERERLLIERYGEKITPEKLAWRRETIAGPDCGGDPDKFDREYPSDDVSAFRSTGSAYFDANGLIWQEQQAVALQPRIRRGDIVLNGEAGFWMPRHDGGGEFRMLELAREDESYIISVDWAVGKQAAGSKGERDAHSIKVWRAERINPQTQEHRLAQAVATTREENRVAIDVAIEQVKKLQTVYGGCCVIPELNNMGNIVDQMEAAGVRNIWTQRTGTHGAAPGTGKSEDVKGFLTNEGTRRQILQNFQMLIRERLVILTFMEIVQQCFSFMIDARGKPCAAAGTHDDEVMGSAIGTTFINAATPYRLPGLRAASAFDGGALPLTEEMAV